LEQIDSAPVDVAVAIIDGADLRFPKTEDTLADIQLVEYNVDNEYFRKLFAGCREGKPNRDGDGWGE